MYSMKNTAMKALTSLLFLCVAQVCVLAQTTSEAEAEGLPATYYKAYFDLRDSFWEGPEKKIDDTEEEQLQQVVKTLNKVAPQSIEALHLRYVHSGYKAEFGNDLHKEIEAQPGDYDELLIPLMFIGQEHDELNKSLERLADKGEIRPPILNYHVTMVQWLPRNAVVVTNGRDDTFALLLAAYRQQRDDLFILPLDYLYAQEFRMRVAAKLGNTPAADYFRTYSGRPDHIEALDQLAQVQQTVVHFALTLPPEWLSSGQQLYAEGFSLSNRAHYSQNPQLTYAQSLASIDLSRINENEPIAVNYLPALIAWFNASRLLGHDQQAEKIADTVRLLAVKTADANKVLKMIGD